MDPFQEADRLCRVAHGLVPRGQGLLPSGTVENGVQNSFQDFASGLYPCLILISVLKKEKTDDQEVRRCYCLSAALSHVSLELSVSSSGGALSSPSCKGGFRSC
jgi:hypothetical protein